MCSTTGVYTVPTLSIKKFLLLGSVSADALEFFTPFFNALSTTVFVFGDMSIKLVRPLGVSTLAYCLSSSFNL